MSNSFEGNPESFSGKKSLKISISSAVVIFDKVLSLGQSRLLSMLLMVCSEIFAFSANSNCDKPFSLRIFFK